MSNKALDLDKVESDLTTAFKIASGASFNLESLEAHMHDAVRKSGVQRYRLNVWSEDFRYFAELTILEDVARGIDEPALLKFEQEPQIGYYPLHPAPDSRPSSTKIDEPEVTQFASADILSKVLQYLPSERVRLESIQELDSKTRRLWALDAAASRAGLQNSRVKDTDGGYLLTGDFDGASYSWFVPLSRTLPTFSSNGIIAVARAALTSAIQLDRLGEDEIVAMVVEAVRNEDGPLNIVARPYNRDGQVGVLLHVTDASEDKRFAEFSVEIEAADSMQEREQDKARARNSVNKARQALGMTAVELDKLVSYIEDLNLPSQVRKEAEITDLIVAAANKFNVSCPQIVYVQAGEDEGDGANYVAALAGHLDGTPIRVETRVTVADDEYEIDRSINRWAIIDAARTEFMQKKDKLSSDWWLHHTLANHIREFAPYTKVRVFGGTRFDADRVVKAHSVNMRVSDTVDPERFAPFTHVFEYNANHKVSEPVEVYEALRTDVAHAIYGVLDAYERRELDEDSILDQVERAVKNVIPHDVNVEVERGSFRASQGMLLHYTLYVRVVDPRQPHASPLFAEVFAYLPTEAEDADDEDVDADDDADDGDDSGMEPPESPYLDDFTVMQAINTTVAKFDADMSWTEKCDLLEATLVGLDGDLDVTVYVFDHEPDRQRLKRRGIQIMVSDTREPERFKEIDAQVAVQVTFPEIEAGIFAQGMKPRFKTVDEGLNLDVVAAPAPSAQPVLTTSEERIFSGESGGFELLKTVEPVSPQSVDYMKRQIDAANCGAVSQSEALRLTRDNLAEFLHYSNDFSRLTGTLDDDGDEDEDEPAAYLEHMKYMQDDHQHAKDWADGLHETISETLLNDFDWDNEGRSRHDRAQALTRNLVWAIMSDMWRVDINSVALDLNNRKRRT